MASANLADAIGLTGVVLSTVATWAQFSRVRRVGVDGVSLLTWFQFILMSFFWIAYGVATHAPIIVAGSAACLPLQVAIVARLAPWRNLDHVALGVAFIGACCAAPVLAWGWSAGALGCGVAMVVNRVPQTAKLLRHPGDLGVSVASWLIGAVCSVAWIGYYVMADRWAALAATAAGMAGNLVIAALATWRHRQATELERSVRPLPGAAEQRGYALQPQG